MGIIGGIYMVDRICKKNEIQNTEAGAGCDGEGTITICDQTFDIIKNSRKHFYLIESLHKIIEYSPV